jgi:VWFA-related protein
MGVAVVLALSVLRGDAQQPPPQQTPKQPQQEQSQQQQPPRPDQPPTFRTGINFVRVDVIVTDKQGGPVGDLSEADFEVTEDGKPQKIETFKLVKLDGGAVPGPDGPPKAIRTDFDEESEAARDDVRLFAVFLDDYHVRRGTSMRLRDPLTRFVQNQLGPSDMIGVMYPLESTAGVRMTRNHEAVAKAIQQFVGRKFEYEPKNEFEEKYAYYPTETVERIRNEVSMSAIKGLIIHMGSLKEGRKALILVSEGYTYMVPPQMRNPIAAMPGGNPQAYNPMAGTNDPTEDRAQFQADTQMQTDLREIYDTANKNNVAIYALDPRGLAVSEFDINENINMQLDRQYLSSTMDTLRTLAEQTDGRAIVNRNDLDGGMKQIVRDTSAYYLIGYNSSQAPSDGKFHEIKVRVKRPGVQVRSRKGYWALTAEETARATASKKPGAPPEVQAALAPVNAPMRTRFIRTWIGTSRGENGKTRVTFVWEPSQKTPGDGGHREEPQRVALMAVGDAGTPYFRGRVPDVAVASTSAATGTGGASGNGGAPSRPSRVTFDAMPGKMQLRVSVEGASDQVLDSEVRDITVPDLTSPTALGTAQVFRARTLRELQQLKADADAVPTTAREFVRTDRLLIRLPAYGKNGTTPILNARLLNRAGQPMSELPIASDGPNDQHLELPLANLPVGEYVVEFKATSDDGGAQELVGFRVTG